jgi:hypothetical protein
LPSTTGKCDKNSLVFAALATLRGYSGLRIRTKISQTQLTQNRPEFPNVANPSIEARLVGTDEDAGYVQFDDFRHFCDAMSVCLHRAEKVVAGDGGQIRYRVKELQCGSAIIGLEALRRKKGQDVRTAVVRFFKDTVAAIQSGRSIDSRLTAEGLSEFRKLYTVVKRAKEVWIAGKLITSRYLANIDEILRPALVSEGTVRGRIERLNVHEKNEFVLYTPLWEGVICEFPEDLFEQVREAIKRNVTVTGKLAYLLDKPYPTRVHVRDLEVLPEDDELPTLSQLRGMFQNCTEGKTAIEFVRAIRDEHP